MSIRELLGFQKGAPKQVDVHGDTLEDFWSMMAGEDNRRRNSILNPIIHVFHSWMRKISGRMRETKITDMEVNCLYSALIAKQPIDPSGCYLSMLAISLRPGITSNPEHLLPRTSIGSE
jgi:hypothetical protein